MRWPPHRVQYCRWLTGVFWKVATCSAPDVTRTASGFQRLKAFTGAADHERQDPHGQDPMASGVPVTSSPTAPQKQLPAYVIADPPRWPKSGSCRQRPPIAYAIQQNTARFGTGPALPPTVAKLAWVPAAAVAGVWQQPL